MDSWDDSQGWRRVFALETLVTLWPSTPPAHICAVRVSSALRFGSQKAFRTAAAAAAHQMHANAHKKSIP